MNWPVYSKHTDVRCAFCRGYVSHPTKSGASPGHGAWQQTCFRCDMHTWYDLYPAVRKHRQTAKSRHTHRLLYL